MNRVFRPLVLGKETHTEWHSMSIAKYHTRRRKADNDQEQNG